MPTSFPLHSIVGLGSCDPGNFVFYVRGKYRSPALVVSMEGRANGLLLLHPQKDTLAVEVAWPGDVRVVRYASCSLSVDIDTSGDVEMPASRLGECQGALLLNGDKFLIGLGNHAYSLESGRIEDIPNLFSCAAFGSWKLLWKRTQTDDMWHDIATFNIKSGL